MNHSQPSSNPGFLRESTTDASDALTQATTTTTSTDTDGLSGTVPASAALLYDVSDMLWQVVPPVLLVFGTVGNVMIVAVMRKLRASPSLACLSLYFTALAVSDQCLLLSAAAWYWLHAAFTFPPSFFRYQLLCTIPEFLQYACSQTSAWFLVVMTYQRVTSVILPHRVGVLCTVRRGKVIVAVVVVVVGLVNFHYLFTRMYSSAIRHCDTVERYRHFVNVFTWVDLCLASLMPFLALITGNSVLIRQVVKSMRLSRAMRGKVDQQATSDDSKAVSSMTVTLIMTSAAFLALTLPVCIFYGYNRMLNPGTGDEVFHAMLNLLDTVVLMLWFAAGATNFYIYLLSGRKFREEAKRCFSWCSTITAKRQHKT